MSPCSYAGRVRKAAYLPSDALHAAACGGGGAAGRIHPSCDVLGADPAGLRLCGDLRPVGVAVRHEPL